MNEQLALLGFKKVIPQNKADVRFAYQPSPMVPRLSIIVFMQ